MAPLFFLSLLDLPAGFRPLKEAPMLANVKTTVSGYVQYSSQGKLIFLLHRLTGLGTLLFLCIHIVDTAVVYFAPALYAEAIGLYRSTPMMLGEIGLVFCVIFHGVNGLRIAYFDLFKPQGWENVPTRRAMWATLVISILLWLPAAGIMSYNILKFNFGMFGG
jgi:succinate dehydrogenase / fumarate reductase cytochrome b subunit